MAVLQHNVALRDLARVDMELADLSRRRAALLQHGNHRPQKSPGNPVAGARNARLWAIYIARKSSEFNTEEARLRAQRDAVATQVAATLARERALDRAARKAARRRLVVLSDQIDDQNILDDVTQRAAGDFHE
ncbi:MAG: hypothetical protein AAF667_17905 [Pseudomonadota bacterium]